MPRRPFEPPNALSRLLAEEEERAHAAKQLCEIAREYPDLFTRFARLFLESNNSAGGEDEQEEAPRSPEGSAIGPTEGILAWLGEHEEGTAGDIVRDLAGRIDTSAEQPAKIIYSTLGSLEKRGKIGSRESHGRQKVYFLTE